MLILQIIGGWLAVSSVCLNVYYFLTIGYQRKVIGEYREQMNDLRKAIEIYDEAIHHIREQQSNIHQAVKNAEFKIRELEK